MARPSTDGRSRRCIRSGPPTRSGSAEPGWCSAARCRSGSRPPITARERDVLVALCGPLANGDIFTEPATVREIAAELTVSENAIKLHLANLVAKFGVQGAERRRSRLANAALDSGVVTLADLKAPHD